MSADRIELAVDETLADCSATRGAQPSSGAAVGAAASGVAANRADGIAPAAPPSSAPHRPRLGPRALFGGVLLRRTVVSMYIWFVASFTYYGLSLSSGNLVGSLHLNFALMALIEIPGDLSAAYLCDRLGRRATLVGALLVGGVACTACAVLPAWLTTAAALVGKFAISCVFALVFVYCGELFPTPVRNAAMGVSSTSARVGGVVAPAVVLLSSVFEMLPILIFGITGLIGALCMLPMPETLGRPLPESLDDCR